MAGRLVPGRSVEINGTDFASQFPVICDVSVDRNVAAGLRRGSFQLKRELH